MTRAAIVLDCDPGLDDAVAILVAARYADLVAITTVNGNVSLDLTTRNALVVTQVARIDVPVHAGAAVPLAQQRDLTTGDHVAAPDASHVHGQSGLGAAVDITPERDPDSRDAVGYLLDITRARSDIHLVAVGPLTNIAMAIEADPGFAHRLASLTIMGGAVIGGNVTAAAEFNIYVDPEAAEVVFGCGVPVRTVPLDLTCQVVADADHVETLRAANTPTATFVGDLLAHYGRIGTSARVRALGALHDPCAVLSVTNPEFFGMVPRRVDVETAGRFTRGMTVVDSRPAVPPEQHNALVGLTVDAHRVMRTILNAAIWPTGAP